MTRAKALKGPELFVRVLASLKAGDKTREQILTDVGISRCAVYGVIDDLFSLGMVHVTGQAKRALVFGFGDGVNALPYSAPPARLRAQVFASVWRSLDAGPVTLNECMADTGRWHRSIATCIAALRENGMACIGAWEHREAGPMSAAYILGPGPDVPKPRRMPVGLVCKRWRDKRKAREMQTAMLTAIRPDLILEAA